MQLVKVSVRNRQSKTVENLLDLYSEEMCQKPPVTHVVKNHKYDHQQQLGFIVVIKAKEKGLTFTLFTSVLSKH